MLEWMKNKFKKGEIKEKDEPAVTEQSTENHSKIVEDENISEEIVFEITDEDTITTEEVLWEEDDSCHTNESFIQNDQLNNVTKPVERESLVKEKDPFIQEKKPENPEGFFNKLKSGLSKTRDNLSSKLNEIIGAYVKIDDEMMEDLEDMLISADLGMNSTMELIDRLEDRIREEKITDPEMVRPLLTQEIANMFYEVPGDYNLDTSKSPTVILIVGVNGVGKTTTIGKISNQLREEGKSVLIAAGDTFRAAAIDQLKTWGDRAGIDVIAHREGADAAAVIFDALQATKARNMDVLICDTAGRLHNKKNLMNELGKIRKVIKKELPEASQETLLVLDATTGQNALQQAKTFHEVTELTGIVLTKLDGTAKGGVVLPLVRELSIPVKYIGVGEGIYDLQVFDPKNFAKALTGLD